MNRKKLSFVEKLSFSELKRRAILVAASRLILLGLRILLRCGWRALAVIIAAFVFAHGVADDCAC